MREPALGQAQEPPLIRTVEHDLSDSKTDELRVARPRAATRSAAARKEIIHQHVKCDKQGIEVGVHVAPWVDVARATPDFGALSLVPPMTQSINSESTI